jgi:hypothetical protein
MVLQFRAAPVRVVDGRHVGRVFLVVGGQVGEQVAHFEQAFGVVLGEEVADAAFFGCASDRRPAPRS